MWHTRCSQGSTKKPTAGEDPGLGVSKSGSAQGSASHRPGKHGDDAKSLRVTPASPSVSPLLPVYLLPILLRELLKTLQTGPSAQPQCGSNCQKTCSNCDTTNWTQRGFCFLAMNQETVIMISAHAVSYAGKEKEAIRGTLRPELMAYKLRRWFHKLTTFWFLQGLKAIFHSKTGDYQNHVMILANPPRKRAHFSVMSWSRSNLILVCLLQPPSSNSWPSSWMVLQPAEANPGLSISFRNAVLILSLLKRK